MSRAKLARDKKRQWGQFLTPEPLAARIVAELPLTPHTRILEPSFGDGSFLLPLIARLLPLHSGTTAERLTRILQTNLWGVEIDPELYGVCLNRIRQQYGFVPERHNLTCSDFFRWHPAPTPEGGTQTLEGQFAEPVAFDVIVGNPPFGGTLDPDLQDRLDATYGFRGGEKIKKETYSFFVVKCVDLLRLHGILSFICSDTFLTIRTMRGLRRLLMDNGNVRVAALSYFSEETNHPMLLLEFARTNTQAASVCIDGREVARADIEATANGSWGINADCAAYFGGETLGDYLLATSGMTIGNNALFLRPIADGSILEPYHFDFYEDPITLAREHERARLGHLSARQIETIRQKEREGVTRRNVCAVPLEAPEVVSVPHPDYLPYNRGSNAIVFQPPTHMVYWKNNGDAVLTYKRNGNWYLHGVGGQKFFGRRGLTWQLIAPRIHARYLPEGYVLDSGAPCAFLRPGVADDELFFILGWALTDLCSNILKQVINHTRNIQSKDFERLPYPFWVETEAKGEIIAWVRALCEKGQSGETFTYDSPAIQRLNTWYAPPSKLSPRKRAMPKQAQLALFEKRSSYTSAAKTEAERTPDFQLLP